MGTKHPVPCPTPCPCSLSPSCSRDTLGAQMSRPVSLFPAQGTLRVPKCPIPCPMSHFPAAKPTQETLWVPKCPTPCPTSQFPVPQLPKAPRTPTSHHRMPTPPPPFLNKGPIVLPRQSLSSAACSTFPLAISFPPGAVSGLLVLAPFAPRGFTLPLGHSQIYRGRDPTAGMGWLSPMGHPLQLAPCLPAVLLTGTPNPWDLGLLVSFKLWGERCWCWWMPAGSGRCL